MMYLDNNTWFKKMALAEQYIVEIAALIGVPGEDYGTSCEADFIERLIKTLIIKLEMIFPERAT